MFLMPGVHWLLFMCRFIVFNKLGKCEIIFSDMFCSHLGPPTFGDPSHPYNRLHEVLPQLTDRQFANTIFQSPPLWVSFWTVSIAVFSRLPIFFFNVDTESCPLIPSSVFFFFISHTVILSFISRRSGWVFLYLPCLCWTLWAYGVWL